MSNQLTSRGFSLAITMVFIAQFTASAGTVRSADNQDTARTYLGTNAVKPLAQTVLPQNAQVKSPTSLAGTWQTYTTGNSILPGDYVVAMAGDFQENIYASIWSDSYCFGFPYYVIPMTYPYDGISALTLSGGSALKMYRRYIYGYSYPPTAQIIVPVSTGDIWYGSIRLNNPSGWCYTLPLRVIHPDGSYEDYQAETGSLIGSDVRAIASDGDNNIWIATTMGVSVIHSDGSWQSYTSDNSGLVSNYVVSLGIDAAQNIWFGTNAGVSVLHTNGTWDRYTVSTSGLVNDNVNNIKFSETGTWFGTLNGVSVLHADGTWQSYLPANSGLVNGTIQTMVIDGNGYVWFGTPVGVSVLSADGIWQTFTTLNSGLSSNDVHYMFVDSGQNIWFGTWGGGISEYGKTGSQFDRVSLSASAPTTADISSLVYVTVTLNGATAADNISGLQLSLSANGLTPAMDKPVRLGSMVPSTSFSRTTSTGSSLQFMLSLPVTSHDVISGDGVLAAFPFYASSVSMHGWIRMDDHLLLDHLTNTVYNHINTPQQIAVGSWGDLRTNAYLQTRPALGQGGIGIDLSGAQGHYTAVSDPTGQFTFTQINSGTYMARLTHALYVAAVRPFTITGATLAIPADIVLWAGDMNGDSTVDNTDWYFCAAASIPVSDYSFDINLDRSTDVRDCMYVASNIGRADMSTTDAPRTGFGTFPLAVQTAQAAVSTDWSLTIAQQSGSDWGLRSSGVNGFLYATGARLSLPVNTTVSSITLSGGYAGGFLKWHQDGSSLYIIATPGPYYVPMRDTDIAVIHLTDASSGQLTVDAQNMIGVSGHTFFIPVATRP